MCLHGWASQPGALGFQIQSVTGFCDNPHPWALVGVEREWAFTQVDQAHVPIDLVHSNLQGFMARCRVQASALLPCQRV